MQKKALASLALTSLLAGNSLLAQNKSSAINTEEILIGNFVELDSSQVVEESTEELSELEGFEAQEIQEKPQEEELSELEGFADEESDDLAGFSDDTTDSKKSVAVSTKEEESIFSLSGNIAFKTSVGYLSHKIDGASYLGFNQAQTALYLQLDAKLSDNWKMRIGVDSYYDAIYELRANTNYNNDVLDTYHTQIMLTDAYFQGRITSNLDLKIGHQIVVWGKSDSIRITDVINPIDNRLPGMTDIEDLRLSLAMLKADYYIDQWNLSAMLIVENRIMLEAAPRGEFFPVDAIFPTAPNPFIELVTPDTSFSNMQYAFAANGIFSGWDLSFYAANVLDQKWHVNRTTSKREVSKINMVGSAVNVAQGSWLFKSEIAILEGVKYNSTTDDKIRVDMLVGFDYMGIKDTVLSLEIANRHIFDHENSMKSTTVAMPDYVNANEVQTAMRATHSFLNDSLNATALVSMFGPVWNYGGFARVWVEYDVMDALVANVGIVDYIDGDKPFASAIKDNDRIFADITYSF